MLRCLFRGLGFILLTVIVLISNESNAATCDERFPILVDYELEVNRIDIERFPNGNISSYKAFFTVTTTKVPETGNVTYEWGIGGAGTLGQGSDFQFSFSTNNTETIFVTAIIDGENTGTKTYVFRPEDGIVPGPTADFSYSVFRDILTVTNLTTNPNNTNLQYRWEFDVGSDPFVSGEANPPEIKYRSAGDYCVSLSAQEKSGASGQTVKFDQFDRVTKDITIEDDVPVAEFDHEVIGRLLRLENKSRHPWGQSMTFAWDFGDGNTSSLVNPEHIYEEPGAYFVSLKVTDPDDDSDRKDIEIMTENELVIVVEAKDVMERNEVENVKVSVYNFETADIDNFRLNFDTDPMALTHNDDPRPAVLSFIPLNSRFSTNYIVFPQQSGETSINVTGNGALVSGGTVQAQAIFPVYVQPDLDIQISASAVEAVGEDVTVTLTITNNDGQTIEGIKVESLGILPNELLSFVSGPIDQNGSNPRVNLITLIDGETITVTWTYRAEQTGVVDLQSFVSFDRPRSTGRVLKTAGTSLAIETVAMTLSSVRISGGHPAPLEFTTMRGVVTNISEFDIENIDFELLGLPKVSVVEGKIPQLPPSVSPRIELLTAGASQEFLIPFGMFADIGSATNYGISVSFTGTAKVEEKDVQVRIESELRGQIDRSYYWADILTQVKSLLFNEFVSFVTTADDWAENSTLGGVAVGSVTGPAEVFQEIGDGIFSATDFAVETVETGGYNLTEDGLLIWNAISEYWNSNNYEQIASDIVDLEENLVLAGPDVMNTFFGDVHAAGANGDFREVSRLVTNSGTNIGLTIGGEIAAEKLMGRLLGKLIKAEVPRKTIKGRTKKPKQIDDNTPRADANDFYNGQLKDWDGVPDSVFLSDEHAFLAGYGGEQLDWLKRKARECNCTIAARPRPTRAVQHAADGLNAKSMEIKLKSESEIDIQWLGGKPSDGGLVMIREPKNPFEAINDAIVEGKLSTDDPLADIIAQRYMDKLAVFKNKDEYVKKLNSQKAVIKDKDGNILHEGEGFVINHRGKKVITKVHVDDGGYLIFDWNGKRVYSDTDLLGVNRRNGTVIDKGTHRAFMDEAAGGIDAQHHAPMQSSDFPNKQVLEKVVTEQLNQHKRGGDGGGVLLISPDGLSKGYVDSFSIDLTGPDASGYANYGIVKTTLTGMQTRGGKHHVDFTRL